MVCILLKKVGPRPRHLFWDNPWFQPPWAVENSFSTYVCYAMPRTVYFGFICSVKRLRVLRRFSGWRFRTGYVSNGPAFMWENHIQTIKYGFNYKKKEVIMIFYSFIYSDMIFLTILMPRVILAKRACSIVN